MRDDLWRIVAQQIRLGNRAWGCPRFVDYAFVGECPLDVREGNLDVKWRKGRWLVIHANDTPGPHVELLSVGLVRRNLIGI